MSNNKSWVITEDGVNHLVEEFLDVDSITRGSTEKLVRSHLKPLDETESHFASDEAERPPRKSKGPDLAGTARRAYEVMPGSQMIGWDELPRKMQDVFIDMVRTIMEDAKSVCEDEEDTGRVKYERNDILDPIRPEATETIELYHYLPDKAIWLATGQSTGNVIEVTEAALDSFYAHSK